MITWSLKRIFQTSNKRKDFAFFFHAKIGFANKSQVQALRSGNSYNKIIFIVKNIFYLLVWGFDNN